MPGTSKQNNKLRKRRGISRVALVGIVAGVAVCLFAGLFTWIVSKPAFTVSNELDVGLRQVLKGELALANSIAAQHKIEELELDSDKAKKKLIEGVYAWGLAQKSLDHQASFSKAEEAFALLKSAEEYGFPNGYEGLGNFALGMVGKFLRKGDESLKPLRTAVVRFPQQRSEAISAIIDILLERKPPEIAEAEQTLEHWLTLPALGKNDHDQASMAKARILLAQQRIEEALNNAKELGQDSSSYVSSQLLQANALRDIGLKEPEPAREEMLNKALAIVRELNESPLPKPAQRRESMYLTGLIQRDLGNLRDALSIFSSIRHGFPETPESLASGVEEIEIAIEMGQPEQAPMIVSYFTKHLGKPELYISDRFVPDQFRMRLIDVGKLLIERDHLTIAAEYARILPEICTESDRIRLNANAAKKQAEKIVAESGDAEGPTGARYHGTGLEEARPYYRTAGQLFDKLAMLELRSPEHSELLWTAIECFQAAHELERSNELLDLYANLETRPKKPRAILAKGENYLALGETSKALAHFRSLIDNFDDSPLAYRCRILSAQALSEQQRFDEATEMLLNNLYDTGKLSPESPLWRDSLFQLGGLLFRRAEILHVAAQKLSEKKSDAAERLKQLQLSFDEYKECIKRLEESIQRYGDDERSFQSQYMLAEAYRKSASLPRAQLDEKIDTTEEKRQQRVQLERELLTNAQIAFGALRKKINSRNDALELDPHYQVMLRNAYFGEADILFALKDYEGALNAYRNTANRYRFEPESLEALMQVSLCQERLEKPRDAKQVLLQAQQILKGIPSEKETRFLEVTPFNRKQWDEHLTWLISTKSNAGP